jgi:hypothetical protein
MVPSRKSIIPDLRNYQSKLVAKASLGASSFPANLASKRGSGLGHPMDHSHQCLKLLVCRLKFRVAVMNHFWRGALEWLFGGNPRKPSLFGQFFVRGKVQPYEKADFSIGGRGRFFRSGLARLSGSCFALRLFRAFSFGFLRWRHLCSRFRHGRSLDRRPVRTVQLVLQLLVEAKSLPPAIQFMPRLLSLLLVGAKIKAYVTVCHDLSLRRSAIQVKLLHSGEVRTNQSRSPP